MKIVSIYIPIVEIKSVFEFITALIIKPKTPIGVNLIIKFVTAITASFNEIIKIFNEFLYFSSIIVIE